MLSFYTLKHDHVQSHCGKVTGKGSPVDGGPRIRTLEHHRALKAVIEKMRVVSLVAKLGSAVRGPGIRPVAALPFKKKKKKHHTSSPAFAGLLPCDVLHTEHSAQVKVKGVDTTLHMAGW